MTSSRLARGVLLAIGLGILGWLIASAGPRVVSAMLRRVGWAFPVVTAAYLTQIAVRAGALWRSLPPGGVRYVEVLRVRLAGEAVEMLTFTGPFLAEPTKAYLLKSRGLTTADAFGGVATEYIAYTLISAWLAVASLAMLLSRGALPAALTTPVRIVIALMSGFTLGCAIAAISGVGLIAPLLRAAGRVLGRRRGDAMAARMAPVEAVIVGFMHGQPARMAQVLATDAAAHALLAFEVWIVVRALGYPFTIASAVMVEGAIKFISIAFFFVPGELGASEGVYTIIFTAIGVGGAVGLTMALVRRIRAILVAGIGLGALALTRTRGTAAGV